MTNNSQVLDYDSIIYIFVHRENFDVLIWVENVLKNRTTYLSWKCFYFVKLAVFKFIVCTKKLWVQSLVHTYQKVVK